MGFSERLNRTLAAGIRLVQLRIENFDLNLHQSLLDSAAASVNDSAANLIINCSPSQFAQIAKAYPDLKIGLHLSGHNAAKLGARPVESNILFGVSCHNEDEIVHAQKISADYLLLSPVLPTASHPAAAPLGWDSFSSLVELANVPVYALGGVGKEHISIAQSYGAQGVAGIRAFW